MVPKRVIIIRGLPPAHPHRVVRGGRLQTHTHTYTYTKHRKSIGDSTRCRMCLDLMIESERVCVCVRERCLPARPLTSIDDRVRE
jgi:hypothetical protein